MRNPEHLDFIRSLPCVACGRSPSEAAHCRLPYSGGVTVPLEERGGTGLKPADKWANPLCADDHRLSKEAQHTIGERVFWERLGINPLGLASKLWDNTGNRSAAMGSIHRARNGGVL